VHMMEKFNSKIKLEKLFHAFNSKQTLKLKIKFISFKIHPNF
jgi:hypothetical protein